MIGPYLKGRVNVSQKRGSKKIKIAKFNGTIKNFFKLLNLKAQKTYLKFIRGKKRLQKIKIIKSAGPEPRKLKINKKVFI